MDISALSLINTAMGAQSTAVSSDVGMLMLRKTLDMAAQQVTSLVASAPQLATSGTLGTQINTHA